MGMVSAPVGFFSQSTPLYAQAVSAMPSLRAAPSGNTA